MNHQALSSSTWSVTDLPRGDYKQSDHRKNGLPFNDLRRLDCVLEATKAAVFAVFAVNQSAGTDNRTGCAQCARKNYQPR